MAQISQNADGTYTKSYSDTELAIIRELHSEQLARQQSDQSLMADILSLENRTSALESYQVGVSDLEAKVNANTLDIEANTLAIETLRQTSMIETYSKTQIDQYMHLWRVEEIDEVVDSSFIPDNHHFKQKRFGDIRIGYQHYDHGDIHDAIQIKNPTTGVITYQESQEIRPNTLRRYTISAYAATEKETEFSFRFGDVCHVIVSNSSDQVILDQVYENTSFDTAKVLKIPLHAGWTKIQILIANSTQGGGLWVESDLVEVADRLHCMDAITGMFSGDQILLGSITQEHISPDMELIVKSIHATMALDPNTMQVVPSGIFGDGESGAIQIGDGVISKLKDEPFVFGGDVRFMGDLLLQDGTKLSEGGFGSGLTTEERKKLDSVDWNAEENQNAFSFAEVLDMPADGVDPILNPLYNVLPAMDKMDSLRMKATGGIDIRIVYEDGVPFLQFGMTTEMEARIERLEQVVDRVSAPLPFPPNFVVDSKTATTVKFKWDAIAEATKYILKRGNTVVYEGTNLIFEDTGLFEGTTYTYYLISRNVMDIDGEPAELTVTTFLQSPNNFTGTATDTSVALTWTPTTSASEYIVKRNGTEIYRGTLTSFTDMNLSPFTEYNYTVETSNGSLVSDITPIQVRTNLRTPTLTVTPI